MGMPQRHTTMHPAIQFSERTTALLVAFAQPAAASAGAASTHVALAGTAREQRSARAWQRLREGTSS
jgi:hypothetical protein